ncbi:MAG: FecR domain-containing protein [Gemmatimonadota bacterium]|nr:FecR domain-containing protein [Gemmatimonadota bacterium]
MTPSHPFDDAPDWDTLARHRAGESTPEEAEQLALWLAEHPQDAALIEALDAVVEQHATPIASYAESVDVERALRQLHQRMSDAAPAAPRLTVSSGGTPQPAPARGHRWAWGGLAAAAAVAAITVALQRETSTARNTSSASHVASTPARDFRTTVGVVDSVVLSDGTRVLLGPASHLIVASSYGHGTREVTLEGVARFSVQHDAAVPFAVHAGSALVRDIGTQFTVRTSASGSESHVSITVSAGEVNLSASSSSAPSTPLHAGDRGEVMADGSVVASRGTVHTDDDAWTRGTLVYASTPLAIVRDDLKRWYGLDLQLADSTIAARRLTATFEHQDADQLLRTLGLALGMRVQRTGAVVTLRPGAIAR